MLIEIVCQSIPETSYDGEISFICRLLSNRDDISVVLGWGCTDGPHLWKKVRREMSSLREWIDRSIRDGIFKPGKSDLFIYAGDDLTVLHCHEADIHVQSHEADLVHQCAGRWLANRFEVVRSDVVPASRSSWRAVGSAEEAAAGL